jgi:hypothetical protein
VEHVQQSITKAAPTSDDRLAAELRRFGLLGIIAILLILFTGNIVLGPIVVPAGAVLVMGSVRLLGIRRGMKWAMCGRPKHST